MMLQMLKNLLYAILVNSGFLYLLFPLLKFIIRHVVKPSQVCNSVITDKAGATVRATKKPNGRLYPPVSLKNLSAIQDLRIRDSDVLLCGYPKTGCHWVYEISHMLLSGTTSFSKHGKELGGMLDLLPDFILDANPSPRILNSHLLYDELPIGIKSKRTKIILTVRSAKDTVVSYYNHHLALDYVYGYGGEFHDFFDLFMSGEVGYGSYFEYTLDWDSVVSSSKSPKNNVPNHIFVLRFEELKAATVSVIQKLSVFLDVPVSEDVAQSIAEASKFSNMKTARSTDSVSKLFRKGMVGDWKNWLTPEQAETIDRKWNDTMTGCKMLPQF